MCVCVLLFGSHLPATYNATVAAVFEYVATCYTYLCAEEHILCGFVFPIHDFLCFFCYTCGRRLFFAASIYICTYIPPHNNQTHHIITRLPFLFHFPFALFLLLLFLSSWKHTLTDANISFEIDMTLDLRPIWTTRIQNETNNDWEVLSMHESISQQNNEINSNQYSMRNIKIIFLFFLSFNLFVVDVSIFLEF